MKHFLSKLNAELRSARWTRRGATHLPEDVPRGLHKTYQRMERIPLPEPAALQMTLADALNTRRSAFSGNSEIPLSLADAGTLLGLGLRKRPHASNRNYPSGGALYPVETYLISTALEGYAPGAYHYNPTDHALERLWDVPADLDMKSLASHPPELPLSTLIVFTSVWHRSAAKYGDLAYLHALIESGHMSENLLLVSTALGLKARPYAGFDDQRVIDILDLHADDETPIHSVTLCKANVASS